MNEDERGVTPADVTAITIEPSSREWLVTVERGNGDVIRTIELTDMERAMLSMMLGDGLGAISKEPQHVQFVDVLRTPVN